MPFMPDTNAPTSWGLIAGNGRFPFLVLEGARSQGIDMAVIALKEEASPELEKDAKRLHWVSLGELSKTIDLMHREGVTQAVMAGQVKHNKIFSAIRPDCAEDFVVLHLSSHDRLGHALPVHQVNGFAQLTEAYPMQSFRSFLKLRRRLLFERDNRHVDSLAARAFEHQEREPPVSGDEAPACRGVRVRHERHSQFTSQYPARRFQ